MARVARWRTAGQDVLHGRAEHGLSRRRARSRRREPGGIGRRPAHPRPLRRSTRSGHARRAGRSGHYRVRERSGREPRISRTPRPCHAVGRQRRHCAGPRSAKSSSSRATVSRWRRSPSWRPRPTRERSIRRCCRASSRARASATTAKVRFASIWRGGVPAAFAAMGAAPCVLERLVPLTLRAVGDRRAQRPRRRGDLAGRRKPPSRRHPGLDDSCRLASRPRLRPKSGTSRSRSPPRSITAASCASSFLSSPEAAC